MTDRRYHEKEVRKILELATRPDTARPRPATAANGLTLADIQSIALEVGVAPDAVARAAAALDAPAAPRPRRSWGMPIEVGRTVPLSRPLTDHEWDQLVAELRTTFRARGRVTVEGGLREWRNSNLHACVEPSAAGYRLRLGTVKGDAAGINMVGASLVAAGAIVFGSVALGGGPPEAIFGPALMGGSGIAAFLANLIRLPRWAQQRQQQMEHIEARIHTIMAAPRKAELDVT